MQGSKFLQINRLLYSGRYSLLYSGCLREIMLISDGKDFFFSWVWTISVGSNLYVSYSTLKQLN